MALTCPNCGRPNSETAVKCIYCSSSLEGACKAEAADEIKEKARRFLEDKTRGNEPPEKPGPGKSAPGTVRRNGDVETLSSSDRKTSFQVISGGRKGAPGEKKKFFWVVVAPVEVLSAELTEKAARLLKVERYTVRTRLAAGTPMIVRKCAEAETAREFVNNLLEIGVEAYSVTEEQFNGVPPRLLAKKVSLVTGGLRFEGDGKDEPLQMEWNGAYLVVKGRIRRKPLNRKTKKKSPFPAFPEQLKSYEVVDIYPREGRGVRVAEGITDFSGLGQYMKPSSLRNLRWILDGIKAASAPLEDDRYKQLGPVFKPPRKNRQELLGKRRRGAEAERDEFMDNSRHFDEYSTLVYLNYRKLGEGD